MSLEVRTVCAKGDILALFDTIRQMLGTFQVTLVTLPKSHLQSLGVDLNSLLVGKQLKVFYCWETTKIWWEECRLCETFWAQQLNKAKFVFSSNTQNVLEVFSAS
jgi:hypothetical protein